MADSIGIETNGNQFNPFLSEEGADLYVFSGFGQGADYIGFYQQYFSDGASYHSELLNYLSNNYSGDVQSFLAMTAEEQLREIGQDFIPEVYDAYFNELLISGNNPEIPITKGMRQ